MTETAKIAANNAYQQNVAAADAAFAEGMNDLNNYVRTEQERLDDKAKAEQDAAYNEIMTTIDSQSWNTTAELKNYLFGEDGQSGVAAGLSDSQKAQVQQRLNYYVNNLDQQTADNEYDNRKSLTVQVGKADDLGGYLSNTKEKNDFKIDGHKVELGTAVEDGILPADKIANIGDKVPFAYNGGIYIKINGTVYSVRGRGGKLDSAGYKDALKYLTGE